MWRKCRMILMTCIVVMMLTACTGASERTSDEMLIETKDTREMVYIKDAEDISAFFDEVYFYVKQDVLPEQIETIDLDLDDREMVTYNTGLEQWSQIQRIILSESVSDSIAYSALYVQMKAGEACEQTATQMMEHIDPDKWLEASAQKEILVKLGKDIFFVMGSDKVVQAVIDAVEIVAQKNDLQMNVLQEKRNTNMEEETNDIWST